MQCQYSNANLREIIATAELGCQHITILAHHLQELATTPLDDASLEQYPFLKSPPPKRQVPYYKKLQTLQRLEGHSKIDPLAGPEWDGELPDIHIDYLADDGKALRVYMETDAAVVRKIKDVFSAFVDDGDAVARRAIEAEIETQAGEA